MANEAKQKQSTNIIGFSIDTTYELFSPSDLVNIIECSMVDGIYHPPINYAKLAKMKGMAAYHESALDFKRTQSVQSSNPTTYCLMMILKALFMIIISLVMLIWCP